MKRQRSSHTQSVEPLETRQLLAAAMTPTAEYIGETEKNLSISDPRWGGTVELATATEVQSHSVATANQQLPIGEAPSIETPELIEMPGFETPLDQFGGDQGISISAEQYDGMFADYSSMFRLEGKSPGATLKGIGDAAGTAGEIGAGAEKSLSGFPLLLSALRGGETTQAEADRAGQRAAEGAQDVEDSLPGPLRRFVKWVKRDAAEADLYQDPDVDQLITGIVAEDGFGY